MDEEMDSQNGSSHTLFSPLGYPCRGFLAGYYFESRGK